MSAAIEPTEPKRVRSFALFFKNYMSISTLIVAALPVPVTSLGLIPTFAAQTKLFSVYSSLFCFLLLGFIFYLRHSLARKMFPEFDIEEAPYQSRLVWLVRKYSRRGQTWFVNMLPLLFITCSLILVFQYNDVLQREVNTVRAFTTAVRQYGETRVVKIGDEGKFTILDGGTTTTQSAPFSSYIEEKYPVTFKAILDNTDLNDIPFGSRLLLIYVGIFVTAEAAFVLMAIKEYLQDLLGLTDVKLINPQQIVAVRGLNTGSNGPSLPAPQTPASLPSNVSSD
jgi:hypothetical protein